MPTPTPTPGPTGRTRAGTVEPPGTPLVLAVVVTHDGATWLPGALRTLAAQRYPALRTLVVDAGSTDGTADLAARRLGEDAVLRLDDNVGFGRAVAAALRSPMAADAAHLLLVHDDMALMPDAVQWLVDALDRDPSLAIVGPKLREWDEEALLQQVGMSADAFGHADPRLDPAELDQGQHDGRSDVLFVSTAGMLLRGDTFATLGGFDPRFGTFRDDLDLCWRAWLAGRRVAVVPQAVGYHHQAATTGLRGDGDLTDARYRIERNTLAAQIKNAGARRLIWSLPTGALLDLLRVVALLLARRFSEAGAVLRAYLWNLANLPGTLRRRRVVQASRRVPDSRLAALFSPGLPRLRGVRESVLELLSGGSTRALVDADDVGRAGIDPLADQPIQRFLRDRPLVLLGVPLLLAFLLSLGGYLGSGPVIGGEVAAWPADGLAFLRAYLSPWSAEPLASASFPSPIQAVLGIGSVLAAGSAWLAQRLAVFGLVPLAFVTMLRAGRLVTSRPWPRVIGAAVYTVSPVVLAPLGEGRWGLAVLAALLPAVVALTITTANPGTPRGVAWRSTALLAIALVIVIGAAPLHGLLAVLPVAVATLVALLRRWARPLLRLAVGAGGAALLLAPWAVDLIRDGGPAAGTLANGTAPDTAVELVAWRALLGLPGTAPAVEGLAGWALIALPAAVLVGALVVGMRARPLVTSGLVLLLVTSGAAAWLASAVRPPLLHPPALLLPGAVAMAVLAIIVARWSTDALTARDFGLAQVGTGVAGLLLVVGLLAGAGVLASGPWPALAADPQLVPAFIGAESDDLGAYRVLLVRAGGEGDEAVRWDLTGSDGPQMTSYGTLRDADLTDLIGDVVTRIGSGADPSAAAVLGVLNVRYVVLVDPDADLRTDLSAQVDLEPLPSNAAVTYGVRTWLPRAALVPEPAASRLLATGDPGSTADLPVQALQQTGPGLFGGTVRLGADGILAIAEASSSAWRAAAGGTELAQLDRDGLATNAFQVPDAGAGDADTTIRVAVGGGLRHRIVVALQALVALALLSLAIRPPGTRTAPVRRESLPQDLVGLADQTTAIPRIQVPEGGGTP